MNEMCRAELYIHGAYTELLAWKSPSIRSYMVYIYSSGHPMNVVLKPVPLIP